MTMAIEEPIYSPLNTPIDGDRDYYDRGAAFGDCPPGVPCPPGCPCNDLQGFGQADPMPVAVWLVPTILLGFLFLPTIVSMFDGDRR